jgi:hypothetical protein
LKDEPLITVLDESSTLDACSFLSGSDNFIKGKIELHELFWMELHLHLPDVAPEDGDARHPGNGQEARPEGPVGNRSQLHE